VREHGRLAGGKGRKGRVYNRAEWKLLWTARNRHILHVPVEWMNEWMNEWKYSGNWGYLINVPLGQLYVNVAQWICCIFWKCCTVSYGCCLLSVGFFRPKMTEEMGHYHWKICFPMNQFIPSRMTRFLYCWVCVIWKLQASNVTHILHVMF
jgi:hypothetical protein